MRPRILFRIPACCSGSLVEAGTKEDIFRGDCDLTSRGAIGSDLEGWKGGILAEVDADLPAEVARGLVFVLSG